MSKKLEKFMKMAEKGKGAALCRFVNSRDEDVAMDAIKALGKCGGEDAINMLTGLLGSSRKDVRLTAIQALGECGGEYNSTILGHDVLNEKDPEIAEAMKEALAKIRKRLHDNQ